MARMINDQFDLKKILPPFMREDEFNAALADYLNRDLQELAKPIRILSRWAYIDEIPESHIDELAWELDIDWYDSSASRENKIEQIREALLLKAKRGTKWAVDRLTEIYIGSSVIQEWFEYDGEPYFFRIMTENDSVDPVEYEKLLAAIRYSKNARSYLEGLYFLYEPELPGLYYSDKDNRSGGMKHFKAGVAFHKKYAGYEAPAEYVFFSDPYKKGGAWQHHHPAPGKRFPQDAKVEVAQIGQIEAQAKEGAFNHQHTAVHKRFPQQAHGTEVLLGEITAEADEGRFEHERAAKNKKLSKEYKTAQMQIEMRAEADQGKTSHPKAKPGLTFPKYVKRPQTRIVTFKCGTRKCGQIHKPAFLGYAGQIRTEFFQDFRQGVVIYPGTYVYNSVKKDFEAHLAMGCEFEAGVITKGGELREF